jgi:hypothetical protein
VHNQQEPTDERNGYIEFYDFKQFSHLVKHPSDTLLRYLNIFHIALSPSTLSTPNPIIIFSTLYLGSKTIN